MLDEIFIGDRLQIAREFRGLTQGQLGCEVGASTTLISFCEAGKKSAPSPDLVQAFGEVLGFRIEYFYLPAGDVFRDTECHFRHRRSTPEKLKAQVRARATLLGFVLSKLRTIFHFPKLDLPSITAHTHDEIEAAAADSRAHWGLDTEAPIHQVGRVLERAGVFIVANVVDSAKVDAFSRSGDTSVIFLNQFIQSTSRWIFDIAHECGHLVLHSGIPTGSSETEAAADRYASAFLLPGRAFSREFSERYFSWEHVFHLKRRWRVSAAAIVRRAFDLGLIGAADYRKAYKHMAWKSWRTAGEPFEPELQEPELLTGALNALGSSVTTTAGDLCRALQFRPETFHEVTGMHVPLENSRPLLIARS
jgi:Zn-dependent peptidase ImmA (M78 family)/transcriptional regulator with XRE-family HTH domain